MKSLICAVLLLGLVGCDRTITHKIEIERTDSTKESATDHSDQVPEQFKPLADSIEVGQSYDSVIKQLGEPHFDFVENGSGSVNWAFVGEPATSLTIAIVDGKASRIRRSWDK